MIKAKEFQIPFSWEKRHIAIHDDVWFMPAKRPDDPFVFTGWDMLFSETKPIKVEYCSGNGTWIVERAKADPESNWLAVEKQFHRARLIWARAKNAGISNLKIALAEGGELTRRFFPDATVSEVFVNFPDPWPKRRHAKHRIIQPEFVEELARILTPEGLVTLVTDDAAYSAIMIREMRNNSCFSSVYADPYFIEAPREYGESYFNSLFREQDKIIRQHMFVRS